MADEEKPQKRTGRRVLEFPVQEHMVHPEAREHVIPPSGINDSKKDPRRNTPPKDGLAGYGKRWTELNRRVEIDKEVTWEEVVKEMDTDELARRQFKSVNGTFEGRPPSRVPMKFIRACDEELIARGSISWRSAYNGAVDTLVTIMQSPGVKESDRIKAAAMIIERIEGKVAEKVVVTSVVGESVDDMLAGIIAEVAEEEAISRAHDYDSRLTPKDTE